MIRVCIAAFTVVFYAVAIAAQTSEQNKLIVTVQDGSSAVIPGAGVRAVEEGTNRIFDAVADQAGQAELHLPKGNFTVRVQARGFATWTSAGFDPARLTTHLQVTMSLSTGGDVVCNPCAGQMPDVAPEDSVQGSVPAVSAEIPVLQLQH
jgi:hypothetical protein